MECSTLVWSRDMSSWSSSHTSSTGCKQETDQETRLVTRYCRLRLSVILQVNLLNRIMFCYSWKRLGFMSRTLLIIGDRYKNYIWLVSSLRKQALPISACIWAFQHFQLVYKFLTSFHLHVSHSISWLLFFHEFLSWISSVLAILPVLSNIT